MYVSNQRRLAINTADRRKEEANGKRHQMRVYEALATKYGDLESASNLARMAGSVFNAIGEQPKAMEGISNAVAKGMEALTKAIAGGSLDKLFTQMKNVNPATPTGAIVQEVIKTPGYIKSTNEAMKTLVDQGEKAPKVFASALITELTNSKMFLKRVEEAKLEEGLAELTAENIAQAGLGDLAASAAKSAPASLAGDKESAPTTDLTSMAETDTLPSDKKSLIPGVENLDSLYASSFRRIADRYVKQGHPKGRNVYLKLNYNSPENSNKLIKAVLILTNDGEYKLGQSRSSQKNIRIDPKVVVDIEPNELALLNRAWTKNQQNEAQSKLGKMVGN